MVTIEYEQSLVETAVFLAMRSENRLECELHQAIDPLYEIPDEEIRQREFVPVFRTFFARLGFDRLIAGLLAERPLIGERVHRCVVRDAPRAKAQSAELLVQESRNGDDPPRRTLVIQVCPQSFLETCGVGVRRPLRGRIITLMRRELRHAEDMLDDRFGYVRQAFSGDPSQQNLQRDRYRVLWDTYVEGGLDRDGFGVDGKKERLAQAFGRVFANCPIATDAHAFGRIYDAPILTHRNFMDWAGDPSLIHESWPELPQSDAPTEPTKTPTSNNCAVAS